VRENELSSLVIGCAVKIHSALGPGLLESAYQECLFYEIGKKGVFVEKEKPMPLLYEAVKMDCGYRVDLMVEGKLIVEVKCVEALNDVHIAQVLT
jgi:GxxExxY protein